MRISHSDISRISLAPLIVLATLACNRGESAEPAQLMGGMVNPTVPKHDFTLTDQNGAPFDFSAETDGYVTLLFFGYTYCPDVCPLHMARMAAAFRELPESVTDHVKVVFVSVDPARDTPERVGDWLASFHPDFIGLTGATPTLDSIVVRLGFPAAVAEPEGDEEGYGVSHPAVVIGYDRENAGRMLYFAGTPTSVFVNDLTILVGED